MKKYLLISMPMGKTKNIGDHIQCLAARQFYKTIDGYIEKEELSKFKSPDGNKVKIILNGWFLWKSENWPPSDDIEPLFVSIHFSPLVIKDILIKKDYLQKYSPIGCRDVGTMNALKAEGISSYFSSCLTLTLGESYQYNGIRKDIYFVDPYFIIPLRKNLKVKEKVTAIGCLIKNFKTISCLANKDFFKNYNSDNWGYELYTPGFRGVFRRYYKATFFYLTYSTMFSKEIIQSAEYIIHILPVNQEKPLSNDDWFKLADELLRKYMKAKLVVTSRIHAALPSLAMETPVIFVNSDKLNSSKTAFNTPGRFDGLIDLFRTVFVEGYGLKSCDSVLDEIGLIDRDFNFKNKDTWRRYAKELSSKCREFMND